MKKIYDLILFVNNAYRLMFDTLQDKEINGMRINTTETYQTSRIWLV